MRTICLKLIWSCNHIQLHVGTHVQPYKDAHTPTTHISQLDKLTIRTGQGRGWIFR